MSINIKPKDFGNDLKNVIAEDMAKTIKNNLKALEKEIEKEGGKLSISLVEGDLPNEIRPVIDIDGFSEGLKERILKVIYQ